MTDRPSQLELFNATVAHQPHEHFLYYAGYTGATFQKVQEYTGLIDGHDIAARFGALDWWHINVKPPEGLQAPDFSRYFEGFKRPDNAFINGIGVLEIPGSCYHFTHYVSPLRNATTLADLEGFPFPNVDGWTEDHMAAEVEAAHAAGRVAVCWVGHMYESAWQMRGYEEFLMDMMAAPEIPDHILELLCVRNTRVAEAAARAGADLLISGDDVASQRALMFDPDVWRKFIKSRWARVYAAARTIKPDMQIWYHSDGNIEAIIPELIDIGVTILNPVQPECMDLLKLKREYGKHLVFDGTVGTQTTMPFGTPEEVRRVVRERKETLGEDGALILSPTHVLEPEVPIENIVAFFEEAAL